MYIHVIESKCITFNSKKVWAGRAMMLSNVHYRDVL